MVDSQNGSATSYYNVRTQARVPFHPREFAPSLSQLSQSPEGQGTTEGGGRREGHKSPWTLLVGYSGKQRTPDPVGRTKAGQALPHVDNVPRTGADVKYVAQNRDRGRQKGEAVVGARCALLEEYTENLRVKCVHPPFALVA